MNCLNLLVVFSLIRWEGGSENMALLRAVYQGIREHLTFSMLGLHIIWHTGEAHYEFH